MSQRPQGTKSKYPGAGGLGCIALSDVKPSGSGRGLERGFPHWFLPSSREPSPYEESEVHDSFHQLIQEQSLRVAAEEGLELLPLAPGELRPALRPGVGRTWDYLPLHVTGLGWVGRAG